LLLTATPLDTHESRRVAQLFLAAEDWPRAEAQYRTLLRKVPEDPNLLIGLARAQKGAGRYLASQRTYRRAVTAGAGAKVEPELALVTAVNDLDPTIRGLDGAERHRRAHELVIRMAGALRGCTPVNALIAEAEELLSRHRRVRNPTSAADEDLDMFDRLWQAQREMCASTALPPEVNMLAAQLNR
jgi:hypothetical protein